MGMQRRIIVALVAIAMVPIMLSTGTAMAHSHQHQWYGQHNTYNHGYGGNDYYGDTARDNNSPDYDGDIKANPDSNQKVTCEDDHSNCQATTINVIGNGNTVITNTNGAGKFSQDYGSPY